ncbi:MAG: phosphodiester glycosidase family protein, partial [Clostridia bacterium]|nr:phosphodiester glycosidase family protein [Clostridia bacterium]
PQKPAAAPVRTPLKLAAAPVSPPQKKAAASVRTPAPDGGRVYRRRLSVGKIVFRGFVLLITLLFSAVYLLASALSTVAHGPSESLRDLLVLSALQASATKWVPGLFLDRDTVDEILAESQKVSIDTISLEGYAAQSETLSSDPWADARDGMLFETVRGATYKAYILLVRDPARVFVGTSSDFKSGRQGINIFDAAAKYQAVAAINAGEFADAGGVGTGDNPIGLTYSCGELVWNDGHNDRTFIGFDRDDRLFVSEGITRADAEARGIRDAVCFQNGNTLITHDGENLTVYYEDGNRGTAQRCAIGQRADGTVILLVTDGRSASSIGATHNDVIDLMISYGAVCAGMLDGGSSAMMYYENYFEKYDVDVSSLDQYQKRGLVNKYKAFTTPRKIPTFFMVGGETDAKD